MYFKFTLSAEKSRTGRKGGKGQRKGGIIKPLNILQVKEIKMSGKEFKQPKIFF